MKGKDLWLRELVLVADQDQLRRLLPWCGDLREGTLGDGGGAPRWQPPPETIWTSLTNRPAIDATC
jgi:hypothetical protein